jgi:hypothetical protein
VLKKRVLRKIFGSKREEVTGEWRRLHNEELHDVYFSPNVIQVNNLRRMRYFVRFSPPCIRYNNMGNK